jgi:hypothetical protein
MHDDLPTAILYVDDEKMARKYFFGSAGKEQRVLAVTIADVAIGILKSEHDRTGDLRERLLNYPGRRPI